MSGNIGKPVLSVRNLCKSYSGIEVLSDINLDIYPGEVHALMGENGAGKSTLSKIISGVISPTKGSMQRSSQPYCPSGTKEAIESGISIVHQEFNLIPVLSVAQNIFLGREEMKGKILINEEQSIKKAKEILSLVKLDVSPQRAVKYLSVAQQQLVEIAKCLSFHSDVIIMDEPTAALTVNETEQLFQIIEELRKKGVAIIYISHKLDEVFRISQKITVLRDGQLIGTYPTEQLCQETLVNLMVGREISSLYLHENISGEEVVLQVKGLTKAGMLEDVSFQLKKGEILGFGGLIGAGRTELMKMIFGEYKMDAGEILLFGSPVRKNQSIQFMVKQGLAYLPESRKEEGILANMKVKHNISLGVLKKLLRMGCVLCRNKENTLCGKMIDAISIKTHSQSTPVGYLSGGNQQKVVLAKWLSADVKILILDEPTRGIDIGAKHEIYKLMNDLCQKGISIIMISSEMPELIGMSDRIIVMSQGRVTGELAGDEINETAIMSAAIQRGQVY